MATTIPGAESRIDALRRLVEDAKTTSDVMEAASAALVTLRAELDDERKARLRAHIDILTLLAVLNDIALEEGDYTAVEKIRGRWERGE